MLAEWVAAAATTLGVMFGIGWRLRKRSRELAAWRERVDMQIEDATDAIKEERRARRAGDVTVDSVLDGHEKILNDLVDDVETMAKIVSRERDK